MTHGRYSICAGSALAALLGLAVPAFAAGLEDENLLTAMPDGFIVGDQGRNGNMDMSEWVPTGEAVDDWTKMVTVQIFHGEGNVDPDTFATTLAGSWQNFCPGGKGGKVASGTENGYPFAVWIYTCDLNPQTGKPENMFMKTIQGADALYDVQYAYRSALTRELALPALAYLHQISACDTRRPKSPCPAGM